MLGFPTPTPALWGAKARFQASVSGEGLTADNLGVILDPVVIVVHVGATALVKELLIATVMGVTAPAGWAEENRQQWVGG